MSAITSKRARIRDESNRISRDEIFDVLSNQRRIFVLRYLNTVDREIVSLRDVVDYVAACETAGPTDEIDNRKRKSVYTALRQTHLPKLDGCGVIEFNKSRGEIRLGERADRVRLYLEYIPENDISWHHYYVGLSGVSALLLVAMSVGLYPLMIGWSHLAVVIFILFGASAIVHAVYGRRNRI